MNNFMRTLKNIGNSLQVDVVDIFYDEKDRHKLVYDLNEINNHFFINNNDNLLNKYYNRDELVKFYGEYVNLIHNSKFILYTIVDGMVNLWFPCDFKKSRNTALVAQIEKLGGFINNEESTSY